jgi:hypothetical protein
MADDIDPEQLLSRGPSDYLKGGFFDAAGQYRPELSGLDAFAIASQLERGEASPEEVAASLEALRQTLPLQEGDPARRFRGAVQEGLSLVAQTLQISNNIVLNGWLRECRDYVKTDADIAAFLRHFLAVLLQYQGLVAAKPPAA